MAALVLIVKVSCPVCGRCRVMPDNSWVPSMTCSTCGTAIGSLPPDYVHRSWGYDLSPEARAKFQVREKS